ncbi:MAG: PEP-CTERM sorting domain-containing protein [Phycisphaera sp.]|nr:PEP-CTERM sorting domain-containing protein [Phycisphaera sp.]
MTRNTSSLTLAALAMLVLVSSAHAAFLPYFDDSMAGGASSGSTRSTTATTASADVSDYTVDSGNVGFVAGKGNPAPAINILNSNGANQQTPVVPEAAAFHLNLTTVTNATYQVAFQTTIWGANETDLSYTVTATAYNGADSTSGTALGSDTVANTVANGGFEVVKTVNFTFVASSTQTTLYITGSLLDTYRHDIWIDNMDINEDTSTVPEPASLALLGLGGLMVFGRGRRRG